MNIYMLKDVRCKVPLYSKQSTLPLIIQDYFLRKGKTYKVKRLSENSIAIDDEETLIIENWQGIAVETICWNCKGAIDNSLDCQECASHDNLPNWEYKGAKSKVENKNYMPELAKMLGLKWDGEISKPFVIKEYMDKNNYHFTKKTVTNSKGDTFPIILQAIINGTLTIDPIVEFAKPIWCALDNDRYLTVLSNGNKVIAFQSHSTVDYYRYKAGNMFDPSAVIPLSQVDKIVEDMKMGYEVGDDGDSN